MLYVLLALNSPMQCNVCMFNRPMSSKNRSKDINLIGLITSGQTNDGKKIKMTSTLDNWIKYSKRQHERKRIGEIMAGKIS